MALAMFVAMIGLAICSMLVPILRRRSGRMRLPRPIPGMLGGLRLVFDGLVCKSIHPWNIFHCILPFGVLAAHLAGSILDRSQEITAGLSRSGSAAWLTSLVHRGAPGLALFVALAALWANPVFRRYPNSWNRSRALAHEPPGKELCLMPGVCGFPAKRGGEIGEFQAVTEVMAGYRASGQSVEIIHPSDPTFYLASGCPPLDRYSPLLPNLLTKHQLAEAIDRFQARKTSLRPDPGTHRSRVGFPRSLVGLSRRPPGRLRDREADRRVRGLAAPIRPLIRASSGSARSLSEY